MRTIRIKHVYFNIFYKSWIICECIFGFNFFPLNFFHLPPFHLKKWIQIQSSERMGIRKVQHVELFVFFNCTCISASWIYAWAPPAQSHLFSGTDTVHHMKQSHGRYNVVKDLNSHRCSINICFLFSSATVSSKDTIFFFPLKFSIIQ